MNVTGVGEFVRFHEKPKRSDSARVGWVVAENGCHLWQGGRSAAGYGMVRVDGGMRYVHRVRYLREVGPIPEGMQLDHFVCDDRGCCNPLHVRPVSHRENSLRGNGASARHAARTHCPKGHPLSGENLRACDIRRGQRRCRECNAAWKRDAYGCDKLRQAQRGISTKRGE